MLDKIPDQFGGRPIFPVGEFYPSLFSSGKEDTGLLLLPVCNLNSTSNALYSINMHNAGAYLGYFRVHHNSQY